MQLHHEESTALCLAKSSVNRKATELCWFQVNKIVTGGVSVYLYHFSTWGSAMQATQVIGK